MSTSPFVLVGLIVAGLLIGRIRLWGLTLGTSGVLFVALVAGHLGYRAPDGVGELGLVVFVFTVGLSAGRQFLRALLHRGRALGLLALVVVGLGLATAVLTALVFGVPTDLAMGVLAGAMTSTPGLAAASDTLPPDSHVAVGFGVGYPFGILGVVLFVHLAGRFLAVDYDRTEETEGDDEPRIVRVLVEITNAFVAGKAPEQIPVLDATRCRIARRIDGNRLAPLGREFRLELGQKVLIVGASNEVELAVGLLGRRVDADGLLVMENERARVVVTSPRVVGRSLREIGMHDRWGVTISRVTRHEYEFVPRGDDVLQFGDQLTLVGDPVGLHDFAEYAGHRQRSFDETDLISLGLGILLGVLVGSVRMEVGGLSLSLGLAGGPLLVGLLLGHLQRLGPLSGHLPRAARMFAGEVGLAIFLADAGVEAGDGLVPVVMEHGLVLCLLALLCTVVPLVGGFLFADRCLGLRPLELLGGMCGGMTSTPGLGAVTERTEARQPVTAYATAYPLALVLVVALLPGAIGLLRNATTADSEKPAAAQVDSTDRPDRP